MVGLLVAFNVEQRVSVPEHDLAVPAPGDAGGLTVPHQDVPGQVVQVTATVLSIAPLHPRNTRRSLQQQTKHAKKEEFQNGHHSSYVKDAVSSSHEALPVVRVFLRSLSLLRDLAYHWLQGDHPHQAVPSLP